VIRARSRSATIFVAEDNPILLQGLGRALTSHGYSVSTAANGEAMLKMLRTQPRVPDLLLLDVMMPGLSGLEVLRSVKEDARLSAVPVILITAGTDESLAETALECGAVDVLLKPFRLTELLSRIDAQVDRHLELRKAAALG
jgi:DNA-binding response OmpR family regulator